MRECAQLQRNRDKFYRLPNQNIITQMSNFPFCFSLASCFFRFLSSRSASACRGGLDLPELSVCIFIISLVEYRKPNTKNPLKICQQVVSQPPLLQSQGHVEVVDHLCDLPPALGRLVAVCACVGVGQIVTLGGRRRAEEQVGGGLGPTQHPQLGRRGRPRRGWVAIQ